jgi:hypothetical protein
MIEESLNDKTYLESWITFLCSLVSVVGSMLVLCSYLVASSQSSARSAQLIRNLALTDFLWFTCAIIISAYWLFGMVRDDESSAGLVPDELCFFLAPCLMYLRMASLLWTCAISFDVLMSVQKRKWLWRDGMDWEVYRVWYYAIVYLLPLPGAAVTVVQSIASGHALGCEAGYEPVGTWYLVFFMELLPISIGFAMNIYVFTQIYAKMALKAFPQSVRKRRRRVMYHYIVVCIICWTPTMVFYIAEIAGMHSPTLELISRTCLYLTGLLNFIVFGLQDPHLKRSVQVVLFRVGLRCLLPVEVRGVGSGAVALRQKSTDKYVFFEENTISGNADISKDKKSIYRHHKLSRADKQRLYACRPDLNPDNDLSDALLDGDSSSSRRRKKGSRSRRSKQAADDGADIESVGGRSSSGSSSASDALLGEGSDSGISDDSSNYSATSDEESDREISMDAEDGDFVVTGRGSMRGGADDEEDAGGFRERMDSNDLARSRFRERVERQQGRAAARQREAAGADGTGATANPLVCDGTLGEQEPDSGPSKHDAAWGTWTPAQTPPPRAELQPIAGAGADSGGRVKFSAPEEVKETEAPAAAAPCGRLQVSRSSEISFDSGLAGGEGEPAVVAAAREGRASAEQGVSAPEPRVPRNKTDPGIASSAMFSPGGVARDARAASASPSRAGKKAKKARRAADERERAGDSSSSDEADMEDLNLAIPIKEYVAIQSLGSPAARDSSIIGYFRNSSECRTSTDK